MSLQVWLPLNGNIDNQGLASNLIFQNLNATVSTSGKIGKCYSFNATNASIDAVHDKSMWRGKPISYALWFKSDENKANGTILEIGADLCLGYNYSNNTIKFTYWRSYKNTSGTRSGDSVSSQKTYDSSKWHHVAITFNGGKNNLYVDGVLDTSWDKTSLYKDNDPFLLASSYNRITLGRSYGSTKFIGGFANDLRIYDEELSPREIKEISKGLVLHYPLNREGFGADNLYTGSADFSGTWVNKSIWTTDSELYNGFTVKKKSSVWGGLAQNIPCTNGDVFTISFYAKVESGGNILSIHRSSLGNVTTGLTILGGNFQSGTEWVSSSGDGTKWKYYWATVQITSSDITYLQWRIENSIADKYLYVCGIKLEAGNNATPWIPHKTDSLYSTMGLSGNIVYDTSGYKYNGMLAGTFIYSGDSPRYQTSTQFNGTDNGILINNLQLSDVINTAVTYSFWIKPSGENGARSVYFGSYSGISWSIEKTAGNIIRGYWNGSPDVSYSGATITDGIWQHVCITKSGTSDIKVYINGALKATSTATHSALTFPTTYRIGRDVRSNDGTPYKGLMSDFRIYATALSADDILELYQVGASLANNGVLMAHEFIE